MTTKTANKAKDPAGSERSLVESVPQELGEVKQFDPARDIENAQIAAKALMSVVERKEKKVMLNGKQYLEFADWQTIAKFFNITTGTEWTRPIKDGDKTLGWEAKAIVYQNGTIIGGAEAACMRDEKNWDTRKTKYGVEKVPEFQLRSMAQTRAHAKALRSILGYIAVLAGMADTPAEEMNVLQAPPMGYQGEIPEDMGDVVAGIARPPSTPATRARHVAKYGSKIKPIDYIPMISRCTSLEMLLDLNKQMRLLPPEGDLKQKVNDAYAEKLAELKAQKEELERIGETV